MMNEIEFKELVKVAVEKLKEDTVLKMLNNDLKYRKYLGQEDELEQKYRDLGLTEKQKAVCTELFDCRDSQSLEYSTHSYIAGLYDAFRIMSVLYPDKWEMENIKNIIFER